MLGKALKVIELNEMERRASFEKLVNFVSYVDESSYFQYFKMLEAFDRFSFDDISFEDVVHSLVS